MTIDIFSKFGWIVPLKNKKGETVAKAFNKIFKSGRLPRKIWTDRGTEFYNKDVNQLLSEKGIQLYSTQNEQKSSVVERWIRTIKTRMWKTFTANNNTVYYDKLDKIVEDYNNTKHRSIRMTPREASNPKNSAQVYFNLYGNQWEPKATAKFKIGDKVRISKYKRAVFDKGFTPNWTEEIFVIDEILNTKPITYRLVD